MSKKQYRSYAEIDHDLQILQLEREIHYLRMKQGCEQVGEQLKLGNLVEGYLGYSTKGRHSLTGKLIRLAVPMILAFIRKRKEKE